MGQDEELAAAQYLADLLAGLDPKGTPRLGYVRRAPGGIAERPGHLLCLSASFNPMTLAHVRLIQGASRIRPPDEILLVLAKANVDKTVTGFPLVRRLTLLHRFAESHPTVSVAAISHGRFVDKMQAIRPHYPEGTRLTFILGFDTLIRLWDPRYYADRDASLLALFAECDIVVANRAPDPPEAVEAFLTRPDVRPYANRIRVIQLPAEIAAISATDVRARLAHGQPIAGLVPPEIQPLLSPGSHDPPPSGGH